VILDRLADDLAHRLTCELGGGSLLMEEIVKRGADMRISTLSTLG